MRRQQNVVLSLRATQDLADIWSFLATRNPYAADRLINRIVKSVNLLPSSPKMGRLEKRLGPGSRIVICGYHLIIYRLRAETVEISRIIDGRRDTSKIKLKPQPASR